jgi:hypothetical protein
MPDERAARLAANEAQFRDVNDRHKSDLEQVLEDPGELVPFVCECGRRACTDAIQLTVAEYERVHADATRFAVLPGHEITDVEDVVERYDRYLVIRKRPETWGIVGATDTRT